MWMSRVWCALAFAVCCSAAAAFDHAPWDQVLKEHVNAIGEVDYAGLKKSAVLQQYVASLRQSSPENRPELFASRGAQLAYWINAYNALVSFGVAQAYPTKSVRDLGVLFGFFRRKEYVLGERRMSLQDLENNIIRKRYREPRIHFAIVCASLSCPKLSREAYTERNLEEQLEFQARQYFGETRNLALSADGRRVVLASILDWYKEDFGGSRESALAYARKYAPAARQRELDRLTRPAITFREYDWSINDPGSRARAITAEERELAKP